MTAEKTILIVVRLRDLAAREMTLLSISPFLLAVVSEPRRVMGFHMAMKLWNYGRIIRVLRKVFVALG